MEELKNKIKELAEKVYKEIGPFGFMDEKEYESALAYEFRKAGLKYLEQLQVNIMYEDQILKGGKVDFIVFDEKEEVAVLVELKAKKDIGGEFLHQLLKYFEAIKSEKTGFPKFLSEKIKKCIILNWEISDPTKKMLYKEFEEKEEKIETEFPIEKFEEFKDIVDIIEISVPIEKKKKK